MRGGPVAVHAAQDVWVWYLRVCVGVRTWVCASCVCTSVLVRACERVRARLWVRGYARTRVCACAHVRACCVWEVCERAEADRLARGPWPPKGHPPDVSVVGTANSSRRYDCAHVRCSQWVPMRLVLDISKRRCSRRSSR